MKGSAVRKGVVLFLLAAPLCLAAPGIAGDLVLGNFRAGDLSGWAPRIFRGETSYGFVTEGGRRVLRAHSRGTASGLYRKVRLDPGLYPVLRWSWKIERTIAKGNERTREGDDYAARVYVVFPRGVFRGTRAINYIWANTLPRGESLPNPYSASAMMVAVESGNDKAGTWVSEERNVLDDYRRLFGEAPPPIGAVAIMTDTDDTGGEAVAYYGDIAIGR